MSRSARHRRLLAAALLLGACADPSYGSDQSSATGADAGDASPLRSQDAGTRSSADASPLDAAQVPPPPSVAHDDAAVDEPDITGPTSKQIPAWAAPMRGAFAMR